MSIFEKKETLTAEDLVDREVPKELCLSPTGKHVAYTLAPVSKKDKHPVSSIWVAQPGKEHSARQLTSGQYNDRSPQWSADETTIAFISDRAKAGEASAVWCMPLQGGGEAYSVTKPDSQAAIQSMKWSPSGKYIAYLSPDDKAAERKAREEAQNDVHVYGEDWDFGRLRLLHFSTREIKTLVSMEKHVSHFTWSEDSSEVAFALVDDPDINTTRLKGLSLNRISIPDAKSVHISDYPGSIADLTWSGANLYFCGEEIPTQIQASSTLYRLPLADGKWSDDKKESETCVGGVIKLGESVCTLILAGLANKLATPDGRILWSEEQEIRSYDAVHVTGDDIVVIVTSDLSTPSEVYSVASNGESLYQLSQHGSKLAAMKIGKSQSYYCKATDGESLDAIFVSPTESNGKPLPTFVLVHGGPYSRISRDFDVMYHWAPWLVSAGYGVICPNYRGSSSRGRRFAEKVRGRMGTEDYSDIVDMVKSAIKDGLVDKERVAIGGWSQGGFLSYLAVTRDDFTFKAAVPGAGVTDWDTMCMTSDAHFLEAELSGGAPWYLPADELKTRHGSPIWHMKNVKTPMLILHGEADARVPVSQAIAFHRGCLHYGNNICELVTYPREPHFVSERGHRLDMLKRLRRFVDTHLA
ncbi:hypothetical protein MMC25_003169 [Agyrium rufum]|nr:hypothetical protein [Agyrium rufum]